VFMSDGKTPAPGVILYYWHTDNNGYYSPREGMDENAKRHGHLRGWVKTGADGRYAIYTIKPAAYPNRSDPAHIHSIVKEPAKNEYFIDDFIFDDDPLLTADRRSRLENRGGNGILRTTRPGDLLIAERDIILGLNVPGYPLSR
jgi:protocatechuate 3,4-dioxygenase, beta subunit